VIRLAAALLAWTAWMPASACSCSFQQNTTGKFLHLNTGGITLPANALGILYLYQPTLDVHASDQHGNVVLRTVPDKLAPEQFDFHDMTVGRTVRARVTPVDIYAQMGEPGNFFHYPKQPPAPDNADLAFDYDDLRAGASKAGLREVSAAVRAAAGLFRIAPEGGFIQGHQYSINDRRVVTLDGWATIHVGPPIPKDKAGNIVIAADGEPTAQLLSLPAGSMCNATWAVLAQRVQYVLPPQRTPYAHLLMAFTYELLPPNPDIIQAPGPARFTRAAYRTSVCSASPPFGGSLVGQGKELILARCPAFGGKARPRQVRGYAGVLELDDALQPTSMTVRFDDAGSGACMLQRLKEPFASR
jgi:hypothetical protein